jgi:hypothetical protein
MRVRIPLSESRLFIDELEETRFPVVFSMPPTTAHAPASLDWSVRATAPLAVRAPPVTHASAAALRRPRFFFVVAGSVVAASPSVFAAAGSFIAGFVSSALRARGLSMYV